MIAKIIIIAAALTAASAQGLGDYADHGQGQASSSQSNNQHQVYHEQKYQPIFYTHVDPVVHQVAPLVHHVAPVVQVQHVAPIVHHAIPIVHHSAPVVHAAPVHHVEKHQEYYSHPKYEFEYHVEDKHTGDIKSQHESRDGDVVKGYYSLHEADGTTRIVHYTADKHNGFNAHVERQGHAKHVEPVQHHQHQ